MMERLVAEQGEGGRTVVNSSWAVADRLSWVMGCIQDRASTASLCLHRSAHLPLLDASNLSAAAYLDGGDGCGGRSDGGRSEDGCGERGGEAFGGGTGSVGDDGGRSATGGGGRPKLGDGLHSRPCINPISLLASVSALAIARCMKPLSSSVPGRMRRLWWNK